MDSSDVMTKWKWKLRNYSVKLKFSTARRGTAWWVLNREIRETIADDFVAVIDRSWLRTKQF